MMRRIASLAACMLGLATAFPAASAEARSDLAGRWATEGFGSIVEVRPCAAAPAEMCGRIVWLWAPSPGGRLRVDQHNPDPALRTRPLVGVEIIRGLRPAGAGAWTGGRLYNPDDGRTYTGAVRLSDGQLELRGCALNIVCKSQTWRRPQDVLAASRAP